MKDQIEDVNVNESDVKDGGMDMEQTDEDVDALGGENEGEIKDFDIREYIRKYSEVEKQEPEGNLEKVSLVDNPEYLDETVKSYLAIFGDKPWGVLKDAEGNLITWSEARELLDRGEVVTRDEAYTEESVRELLTNWMNLDNSHITIEVDEKGKVFSLLAWFEHDTVQGVVDQIQKENYAGDVEWEKEKLQSDLENNTFGKLVYIADMAKLPSLRRNVWHTMSFWFNMMKEFTVDYYSKNPSEDGMSVMFRTSTKEGAPLDKQIKNIFPGMKPANEEDGGIAYYIMREKPEGLSDIINAIEEGSPNDLFDALSKVEGAD